MEYDAEAERGSFSGHACTLIHKNRGTIKLCAITVYKENVMSHIRSAPDKLYNYMVGLSPGVHIATYDAVYLRSDDRREAANALDDYLKTHLWLERSALTDLIILNCDSSKSPLV